MSSQVRWRTALHPSPFFLFSSQVTIEEAPAVPTYIQLARVRGKVISAALQLGRDNFVEFLFQVLH